MKKTMLLAAALCLACGAALAQLALPGAAPDDAPKGDAAAPAKSAKPKHHFHRLAAKPATLEPAYGRLLRLNGRSGELKFERGDGNSLRIVKYTLLGEVISNPSQQCRIDIVADKPIEATLQGAPEGLPRYGADIAACPLTFDLVGDGALVPAQSNACVFTAADCQANPSGLWGPEPGDLEKDARAISQERAAADRSIQDSLRTLAGRTEDAPAELSRDSSDFAARRDDLCQAYAAERRIGFCASRLAQARAAQLAQRVAAAGPVRPAKAQKRRKKAP
jgi:hypothetical protein